MMMTEAQLYDIHNSANGAANRVDERVDLLANLIMMLASKTELTRTEKAAMTRAYNKIMKGRPGTPAK